jgi:hypothetical protein
MESVVRNVREIESNERQVYEHVLQQKLQDHQHVIVRVINVGVEPPPHVRDAALRRASEIARQGRAHAAAQGVTPEEADAAIDEAIEQVRRRQP